uniref:EF-hand domain-containing protein n=2 Tax=Biomphalaria glabrata TaxID=6526 RepID=A0A2C9KI97_BIOGL|nr:hypothetical protein BgiMline_019996 [Biomphalaria glabrata]
MHSLHTRCIVENEVFLGVYRMKTRQDISKMPLLYIVLVCVTSITQISTQEYGMPNYQVESHSIFEKQDVILIYKTLAPVFNQFFRDYNFTKEFFLRSIRPCEPWLEAALTDRFDRLDADKNEVFDINDRTPFTVFTFLMDFCVMGADKNNDNSISEREMTYFLSKAEFYFSKSYSEVLGKLMDYFDTDRNNILNLADTAAACQRY